MISRAIIKLFFHLGRIATGYGFMEALRAPQWDAIGCFHQFSRLSRTPFSFHTTTRVTVSKLVKRLGLQGFLAWMWSENDRHSVRLVLTDKARDIPANNLLKSFTCAADSLPPGIRGYIAHALQRMLIQGPQERGKRASIPCQHLENNNRSRQQQATYFSELTSEPPLLEVLDQIYINCIHGQPMMMEHPATGAEPR
jgi:DNA-binding MarR family transcriptional regulator